MALTGKCANATHASSVRRQAPACVKVCPTGALTLLTEEDFKARQMEEQKKKAAEMMKKQLER